VGCGLPLRRRPIELFFSLLTLPAFSRPYRPKLYSNPPISRWLGFVSTVFMRRIICFFSGRTGFRQSFPFESRSPGSVTSILRCEFTPLPEVSCRLRYFETALSPSFRGRVFRFGSLGFLLLGAFMDEVHFSSKETFVAPLSPHEPLLFSRICFYQMRISTERNPPQLAFPSSESYSFYITFRKCIHLPPFVSRTIRAGAGRFVLKSFLNLAVSRPLGGDFSKSVSSRQPFLDPCGKTLSWKISGLSRMNSPPPWAVS